jgi:hypothetical protein
MRLPASPVTPEDVEARATLTIKKFELEAAEREAAHCRDVAQRKLAWGFPLAKVPGSISHITFDGGRTIAVDEVDGQRVARITPGELRLLSVANPAWTTLNPHLMTM